MDGRRFSLTGCLTALAFLANGFSAAAGSELQRSWRDDAALRDVQFVSARQGWAVGDHGALWQTTDGGQNWKLTETGSTASLRSLCLLTDEIGWIAGREVHGTSDLSTGVLLATRDGGRSWESLATQALSPLRYVKFFGLEEGVVIGEPSPENGTGVWATQDGGKTWQPLEGRATRGWNAAALAAPEMGLLADREGNVTLLAGPQLLPSRLPPLRGRAIRDISLSSEHHGWLVGDGGLVMHSQSGGVVWEPPEAELPDGVRLVSDFRTVAVKDDAVWIAGNPGGIIWHRSGTGERWIKQPTGITTPLNKLHFLSATHGCAVGDLGVISVTTDGGETWTTARGKGRHLAVLSMHARARTIAPEVLAKVAGEQGYRSAVAVAIRPTEDAGPGSTADRVQAAVVESGGNAAELAWQLPLDIPGMELDAEKLLEHWQRRTEGKLPQTLLGRLVRQIRAWRPHVLILEQPAPDDAAAQLIFDAMQHAIEQAGDGTRFVDHRDLAGLTPWKVDRIYLQLLPGSTGEIAIDPFEVLPRWQANVRLAAAKPQALLTTERGTAQRWNYRAIDRDGKPLPQAKGTDFFSGLSLPPGGDVRRQLSPFDDRPLEQIIKAAQRQRNYLSFADQSLDDPRIAGQMIAQLKDVTAEMTPSQAAVTLFDLFQEYRQRAQWELAEATATELLRRYPEQPASADAARWLLPYFVSEEVAWRRVRKQNEDRGLKSVEAKPGRKKTIPQISQQAHLSAMPELKERLPRANQVARQLEESWPSLSKSPAVQFPLAALHRARGSLNHADSVYRRANGNSDDMDSRDWSHVLRREIWLSQQAAEVPDNVATCFATPTKPELDGVLSDECWQDARELMLAHRTTAAMPDDAVPMVMMTFDDEYLYLAASVPRIIGQSAAAMQTAGRTHDADLRRHDRLSFFFDLDRDYTTWYSFHVDHRGCTSESCWDDAGYNPKWHVAAQGDATHWRTEFAIPWSELAARPPSAGSTWAIGLERTAPAQGQHIWSRPAASHQPGQSLGLMRFE